MRRFTVLLACLLPIAGLISLATPAQAVTQAAAAPAVVTNSAGGYHPIRLVRVFSTSSAGLLAPAVTRKVQVAGANNLPTNIVAVEVNVTVRVPAKSGSLAVFPGTSAFNGYGTVSFTAGQTQQRMITANLGTDGSLALRNNVAGADLEVLLDVVGYYVGGAATQPGAYHPIPIQRVLNPSTAGTIGAHIDRDVIAGGHGAIPASGSISVVVNLTVQSPTVAGTLSVYPGTEVDEGVSPIVFTGGATVQKMVTVGIDLPGQDFHIRNTAAKPVAVIADVVGYFVSGTADSIGGFVPTMVDSKPTLTIAPAVTTPLALLTISPKDFYGLPAAGVWAVRLDVQVSSAKAGSISVFSGDESYTGVATSSFQSQDFQAYVITVRVSSDGHIRIRNNSSSAVSVVTNVTGYFNYRGNPVQISRDGTSPFPTRTAFGAISCAGVSFCASVEANGIAAIYNGRSWTSPSPIPGQTSATDVACAAVDECFAVGNQLAIFDGTGWTVALPDLPVYSAPRISCASSESCIATFGQRYAIWDGTSWSLASGSAAGATGFITSLSCATATFCVGIDNSIYYTIFDGSSWSQPTRLAGQEFDMTQAVSCVSVQFCELVTNTGLTSTFDGTSWSAETRPTGVSSYFKALSCVAADFCLAVDREGSSRVFSGSTWSDRVSMGGNGVPLDVDCPVVSLCVAITWLDSGVPFPNGDYRSAYSESFDGTEWSSRSAVSTGFGKTVGLSCPTTTFCAAVSPKAVNSFDGTAWSTPQLVDVKAGLTDVACSSDSFCVAIGTNGDVIYQNGSWSSATQIDPDRVLTAVACSISGQCVVGDDLGQVSIYAAEAWSSPSTLGVGPFQQLACGADGACLALSADGHAQLYRAGGWHALPQSPLQSSAALSCSSSTYCLEAGPGGSAAWNGKSWVSLPGLHYYAVSCVGAMQCEGIDDEVQLIAWDGHYQSSAALVGDMFGRLRISCPTTTTCFMSDGNRTVTELDAS